MDFETYIEQYLDTEIEDILLGGLENGPTPEPIIGPPAPFRFALNAQDVRRLTLFKWQYSLESAGFSAEQARHLLFLKWLAARKGEWAR